ncbi:armadillo-like helical domain-containing protein [Planoprotostelium fungivorum]|uniref:Armadillo-like helical domain-containing protein n=1 Tax=Planoprotostelium fungivorum TaxID=1890364 RepID=A0A2P6NDE4_9EUKA|nr:armadillo-like helical domain-containing protein [Planoprotostelium fungivorum]
MIRNVTHPTEPLKEEGKISSHQHLSVVITWGHDEARQSKRPHWDNRRGQRQTELESLASVFTHTPIFPFGFIERLVSTRSVPLCSSSFFMPSLCLPGGYLLTFCVAFECSLGLSQRAAIQWEAFLGPRGEAEDILQDYERGIRSGNIGTQCEAIILLCARVTSPASKNYSYTFINSVTLKLADLFRTGNNRLRMVLYQSFRKMFQKKSALSLNVNIEEVLRRFNNVLQSNDPVARSITLRTLGSLSFVLSDQINIHHSIRKCLQSHHQMELHSAIYVIDRLCATSSNFAQTILPKITEMIRDLQTDPNTKLRLIRIYRHMHSSPEAAEVCRATCISLLPGYSSTPFQSTIVRTLTQLSIRSLFHIPPQIAMLLRILEEEDRIKLRLDAMEDMITIAMCSPYENFETKKYIDLIEKESRMAIYNGDTDGKQRRLIRKQFQLIRILSKSSEQCRSLEENDWIPLLTNYCTIYNDDPIVLFECLTTMINMIQQSDLTKNSFYSSCVTTLFSLLVTKVATDRENYVPVHKEVLKVVCDCVRKALSMGDIISTDKRADIIDSILRIIPYSLDRSTESSKCLNATLENISHQDAAQLFGKNPQYYDQMYDILHKMSSSSSRRRHVFLGELLRFTTIVHQYSSHSDEVINIFRDNINRLVRNICSSDDMWYKYNVCVSSMSAGLHPASRAILTRGKIREGTISPVNVNWMECMEYVSEGETMANLGHYNPSIHRLQLAITKLTACQMEGFDFEDSMKFLRCRISLLTSLMELHSIVIHLQSDQSPSLYTQTLRDIDGQLEQLSNEYHRWKIQHKTTSTDHCTLEHYEWTCNVTRSMVQYVDAADDVTTRHLQLPEGTLPLHRPHPGLSSMCDDVTREVARRNESDVGTKYRKMMGWLKKMNGMFYGYPPLFFAHQRK